MSERYYLKYKDITIGIILKQDNNLKYLPNIPEADKLPVLIGYPPGIFKLDRSRTPWTPIKTKVNESAEILNWIIRRTFAKDRHDISSILSALGLKEYDSWELIEKTKGKSKTDNFWVTTMETEKFTKKTTTHLAKEISDKITSILIF